MGNFLCTLAGLGLDADASFGGKAAGLGRLHAAGAKVPPGFAVAARDAGGPAGWRESDRAAFRTAAAALLAGGPVAVRSSAVGEDGSGRSYAGLFDTVLGVSTVEAAVAAATRCAASGANERVRAYAAPTAAPTSASPSAPPASTSPVSIPVGLVVQSMVHARAAGVCFTRDPMGRDGASLVEAVPGLGDALVSGRARPERWRVYATGLGGWEPRLEARGDAAALSVPEAARVAAEAARIATRLGRPLLDLEWALDAGGRLWWLQARAITAVAPLPPPPDVERSCPDARDGPVTVWANWNVRETMPDALSPLVWGFWRDEMLPFLTEHLFATAPGSPDFRRLFGLDLVQGRIYWNMNAALATPAFGPFLPRLIPFIDVEAAGVLRELLAAGVLRPRRLPGPAVRRWIGVGIASVRVLARVLAACRPRRSLALLAGCAEAVLRRPPLETLDDRELATELLLFSSPAVAPLRDGIQIMAFGGLVLAAAELAFRPYPEAARRLLVGIEGNPTTAISLGIDELVEAARPVTGLFCASGPWAALEARLLADAAGRTWLARFRSFLDGVGHRGTKEFDLGAPRWSEDPSMLVELVRAGLASAGRERLSARMARLRAERSAEVAAACASAPAWRRPFLRALAAAVTPYVPVREAPKHHTMVIFQRIRRAMLELGKRFAQRGWLERADDVLYLEWVEAQAAARSGRPPADARVRVAERRRRHAELQARPAPDVVRSDGVPVPDRRSAEVEAAQAAAGVLRGTGVGAGRAAGPVRILREPNPRAMREGDVLVVELADPGWTPLFPRAAALVMEVGGAMCHAAVVAREMGIPSVFGVRGATRVLRDGERVVVDGVAGTVRREAEGAGA
ncbi:MAG: hypothetical protein HYZ53_28650 [Planctomycetes bacterium]|nr:hypothetical protein [Planctomycetota bacterium]